MMIRIDSHFGDSDTFSFPHFKNRIVCFNYGL